MEPSNRKAKGKVLRADVEPTHYQIDDSALHHKSNKNADYSLHGGSSKGNEPLLLVNQSRSGEDLQNASGSESESVKDALKKQRSADFTAEEYKAHKYKGTKQANRHSDTEENSGYPSSANMIEKEKRIEDAYSSSVGSTKDRDNSNSSSVNSRDSTNPNAVEGQNERDRGTYFEDKDENKTYMIKTSGTIVDVNKKRKRMRKIPMSVKKPVSQYVAFIKSPFKGRPPVLFFPYPSYVSEKKDEYGRVFFKTQDDLAPLTMRFKISETTNIYNAVVNACKAAGMYLVGEKQMLKNKRVAQGYDTSSSSEDDEEDENENNFNILFSGAIKDEVIRGIRSYQKVNHFPNSFNIGRKDAMWK